MSKPGEEGERRLIKATAMLVKRYVESNLPKHQRGIHAPKLDDRRIEAEVKAALNDVVSLLVDEVKTGAPAGPPPTPPSTLTQRLSVLDNADPCVRCERVRKVAIHDYKDGEIVAVECEFCAPEFNPETKL